MAADAIAIAKQGIEAFNRGDWEETRRVTAADAAYFEAATGRRTEGFDKFLEIAKAWRAAFPDGKGTVTNAFADGEMVALEITWTGTHTGPLAAPTGGTIPATGRKVSFSAAQVSRVKDGKVTATNHYFDLMTMLAQLGVVPAPARA